MEEQIYKQMLALLEEILANGEMGPEALYAWYLDNVELIEAVIDESAPAELVRYCNYD